MGFNMEGFVNSLFGFTGEQEDAWQEIRKLQQQFEITDEDIAFARSQTDGSNKQTLLELEDMIKRNQFKTRR